MSPRRDVLGTLHVSRIRNVDVFVEAKIRGFACFLREGPNDTAETGLASLSFDVLLCDNAHLN